MLTTFLTNLKVELRDRSVLMWAVAFPLILSTLFFAMFSNLDEAYQLDPIPVIVVEDDNYRTATQFAATLDALAGKEVLGSADDDDASPLLAPTAVESEDAALAMLKEGSEGYKGYLTVDAEGTPTYHQDAREPDGLSKPSQAILTSVLDRYVQDASLITAIIEEHPQLLADESFLAGLIQGSEAAYTEQLQLTANPPSDSLRYFYAVLAFSTVMMTTFALTAVSMVQGNTSPLGARRSLGGQSKLRTLVPTLAAAWLLGFACVLLGFVYLRFGLGVNFGGREAAVVLTLAASTLCSTFLGAFLGALALPIGVKSGLVSFLSCFLSLFAGLYGPFSQNLGDLVARELPWLSAVNPVRQVYDAFMALYYYDGFEQLGLCLLHLFALSAVFFVLSVLMLKRQRYASL
jgi:hypothetical protein